MEHRPDPPETLKARLMRRLVSGVLLCIPIVVVGFCLYELYQLAIFLVDPVIEWLGDDAPWTALGLHVIGLLLVVLFIYFIGFVADLPFIANRVDRLDRLLAQFLPGYSMLKGLIGGVVDEERMLEGLRPVAVETAGGYSIGFEVERTEKGKVVVFLPNAPSAATGRAMVFEDSHVERLNIPPHRVIDVMSFNGRGLASDMEQSGSGK